MRVAIVQGNVPRLGLATAAQQTEVLAYHVAATRELAAKYGERYEPPASPVELADRGEVYSDEAAALTAA